MTLVLYYDEGFLTQVGQYYIDEGLLYKTTMVIVRRGLIVGFHFLVTAGK